MLRYGCVCVYVADWTCVLGVWMCVRDMQREREREREREGRQRDREKLGGRERAVLHIIKLNFMVKKSHL